MADNLFTACEPRTDVLQGALKESDFAADLSQVLRGDAPDEYKKPELFFANTYPTKGLKNVLKLVALRVLGRPEQVGAIFRLDTQSGGGKTHTLGNFQRVRGMLRLLARTVARLWQTRPADAYAIHTHHIDLGFEPIRLELVARLKQDTLNVACAN